MSTKSVYSFGVSSPIKIEIPDYLADLYNEAVAAWFDAQKYFREINGRLWNPKTDGLTVNWSKEQREAWNTVGRIFTEAIKTRGEYIDDEIHDDYLVKNVVLTAEKAMGKFGWGLSLAVLSGVVYGLLRGSKL